MNQAQRRRLRTSCLLLLLPLLVAGTPRDSLATASASPTPIPTLTPTFEIKGLTSGAFVRAGEAITVTVTAMASGTTNPDYAGTIRFSSPRSGALLPANYTFNPTVDGGTKDFLVTFPSAGGPWELLIQDVNSPSIYYTVANITVTPGPFAHVALSTLAPDPTPTCSEATLVLTAEDAWGNPVTAEPAATVTLCAPSGSSVAFVKSTLDRSAYTDKEKCVTGSLASTAQVIWKDTVQEDVAFTVTASGFDPEPPLTLHFRAGIPSRENSSFSFTQSAQEPAPLLVRSGQLTARLTLRDQCGNPATLPADKSLSFAANPPLSVTSPVEDSPGRWTTSVSLPECPTDASKPLAVWPLINNEVLRKPNGEQVQRLVQPQCSVVATLSVLTSADSLVAEPGGTVEFEVQVSTETDLTVTGGVLMLEPQGLTVLGASINGQALPARGGGFELPELRKGSPLTVKVTAQSTIQPDQQVSTKVWAVNLDGTLLTQTERVDFKQTDLGVDVGCGCHGAGQPGQLVTWLALFLVASRPWGGLRRLRRSERNDS